MYVQVSNNKWVNDANILSIDVQDLRIFIQLSDGSVVIKECDNKDQLAAWLQQPFNIWSA